LICIVINALGRGGAEKSILLLAEELSRRGDSVQIVCLFACPDEYLVSVLLQERVVRLDAPSAVQALWRLHRHLRHQRPRVVFSLMPHANLAATLVARWQGLLVLTSERTTPTLFYRSALKLNLALWPHAWSNAAVFISNYALDRGLPTGWLGRSVRRNACVLHNPVPCHLPLGQAQEARRSRVQRLRAWVQAPGAAPEPLRLLLASRLVPGKGVLEFVQWASPLISRGACHLTVAGAGPLRADIEALVERQGLTGRVHVQGFVEDIFSAYRACDVVVLSSESEGFGRVGFEAYQSGCLLLGTPRNSFAHELVAEAPAWCVVDQLKQLEAALRTLAKQPIPDDGADIATLRDALRLETHADRFQSIVTRALSHV
jgi:glycosyltransferase involved in cell wall biosynthesis